ncbi:Beta-lactamase [Anaerovibrio sp. JC8]|uniref:serine hydrolase domain-containing protein n=1 Tax=Anaerovibrio sp. JC8 TaxID=1240085 RepID=UPI000A0C5030|nr:serine hydrolase domain-containing protein [Anaerovibrio sp. JC8]ORT99163.1 Beta-lactamase [Anaerovibrio sp. JC8]
MVEYEALKEELSNMVGNHHTQVPGLGAVLIKDGKPVFSYCGGYAAFGAQPKLFKADSLFRIASVSKQFTVYAIMQLLEAEKLDINDDVSDYLGFKLRHPDFPDRKITIKMLANHTSGLRDGIVYCIPPDYSVRAFFVPEGKFYEDGAHFSPANEPVGEYFCYCNLNYGLLGTIIEAVTGERFDNYMQEHILSALDMDGGYLPGNLSAGAFASLSTLYQKKDIEGNWRDDMPWRPVMDNFGDVQPDWDTVTMQNPYAIHDDPMVYSLENYKPGTNATFFAPQGGLRISLEGMYNALIMLMNKGSFRGQTFLTEYSINEMTKAQWSYDGSNGDTGDDTLLSYGLGLYQVRGDSPARVCEHQDIFLVGHTGQAFGLYSGMFYVPGTKDGFVYIMNGEGMAEEDERSHGEFSNNFIWEEKVMNALCRYLS